MNKDLKSKGSNVFDIDSSEFTDLKDILNFDTSDLVAMRQDLSITLKDMSADLSKMSENFNVGSYTKGSKQKTEKEPTRIEKKSFSNISEIEFFHKYGNIIVQESASKQIELEIQYFDTKTQKGSTVISTSNKLLSISTNSTGKGYSMAKVNYIISIPRNVGLNIDSKYGNIRIGKFQGAFSANLSYTDLTAQLFVNNKPSIKSRYGDIVIQEAQDIVISGSYSKIKINKAQNVEVSGNYNNCYFDDVQTFTTGASSAYGDFKIGTVANMNANLKYADVMIDNLLSSLIATCSYTDISIKSTSSKLKSINVKGSYSDVGVSFAPNLSVSFDISLIYGDLVLSKKYNVKYTESRESDKQTIKKGQIGTGTPTAQLVVSNNYADVKIK